jgi:hypothetical protein
MQRGGPHRRRSVGQVAEPSFDLVEHGEIDPGRLTPRIAGLPADLLRHELLMTLRPVPDETIVEIVEIVEIVDDILPALVRYR